MADEMRSCLTSVFESSARMAILAGNRAQVVSSLSGLVPGLYRAYDSVKGKGKARQVENDHLTLEDGLNGVVRDIASFDLRSEADHRSIFASMLLLYHLVTSQSTRAFHDLFSDLTSGHRHTIRGPPSDPTRYDRPPIHHSTGPFLPLSSLSYAPRAARALSKDRFSPLAYFTLLADGTASPYERIILSWIKESVRDRVWEVVSRGYLEVSVDWGGQLLGLEEEAVRRLVKNKGKKVDSGGIKMR